MSKYGDFHLFLLRNGSEIKKHLKGILEKQLTKVSCRCEIWRFVGSELLIIIFPSCPAAQKLGALFSNWCAPKISLLRRTSPETTPGTSNSGACSKVSPLALAMQSALGA
jgi:hypothetical protein